MARGADDALDARVAKSVADQDVAGMVYILGKGGETIKWIGAEARKELSELLERPVHLFLHVKVMENWSEQPGFYRDIGLDFDV